MDSKESLVPGRGGIDGGVLILAINLVWQFELLEIDK